MPSNRKHYEIIGGLAFALALHIALVFLLPSTPAQKTKKAPAASLAINFKAVSPKSPSPEKAKPLAKSSSQAATAKREPAGATANEESAGAARDREEIGVPSRNYGRLLPQSSAIDPKVPAGKSAVGLVDQHVFAGNPSGEQRQAIIGESSSLTTLFDVPLLARRRGVTREASVWVVLDRRAKRLSIEKLRGEPLLRAVLFETLLNAETRPVALRLFEQIETSRIRVSIQTEGEASQEGDIFSWKGDRLYIIKATPPARGVGGMAIALPDEEAKRAERADAVHLARLQRSLAYRSPLAAHTF